jgi:hypothetical protein
VTVLAMEPIDELNSAEPNKEVQSWPGLLAKLFVDFTKVVEAEARLVRASIEPTLSAVLDRWLLQIVTAAIALAGCLLLLAAVILLLHEWLPWWEAFGVVGAVTVVAAIVCGRVSRR